MENQTRYNLNAAIEGWRTELAAQPNLTAEVRRELETSLHDAIIGFQESGLNEEESFWLARRRIGHLPQLDQEFAKVDPTAVWRERAFWILAFTLGSKIAGHLCSAFFAIFIQLFHLGHWNSQSRLLNIPFIVVVLSFDLPFMAIIFSISRGRIAWFAKMPTLFFGSRFRFGIIVAAMVVVSFALAMIPTWWQTVINNPYRSDAIRILCLNFTSCISPLVMVVLLMGLIPSRYQRASKAS